MPSNHDLGVLRYRLRSARAGQPLVITTSGSTERPKHVALSWSAMQAAAEASANVIGSGNWLLALPTEYVAGAMVDVRAQLAGKKTRAWGGESFAAASAQLDSPKYVSIVPAQLADLLADATSSQALAGYAAVLVGGQRVPVQLREQAVEAGVNVVVTYGSTETCGGCVYNGRPLPGVQLRVDDDGRLWIAGLMLADGYLNDDGSFDRERTDATFVTVDGVRWLRTDDRAHLHHDEQGVRLEVLGRFDDVMISGGLKLDLAEVQRALDAELGSGAAVAVAIDGTRWGQSLGVWFADSADERILPQLVETFGTAARAVTAHGAIPLLSSGKPDRVAIAAALRPVAEATGLLGSIDGDE